MKRHLMLVLLGIMVFNLSVAGQITIEACQEKARSNYPLIKRYQLIDQSLQYSLENANKAYLPQFNISARTTYQSDVTKIPPGLGATLSQMTGKEVTFASINKDQYQLIAELNQLIWDGGVIKSQKKLMEAATEAEKQKLEVDLYLIKDRVNQLFLGILALNEQLRQIKLLQNELQINYDKLKVYMQNGIANQSDLDMVKVEQLKAYQQETSLTASSKSYKQMLAYITGDKAVVSQTLVKPLLQPVEFSGLAINRPELKLFEVQNNILTGKENLIKKTLLPKAGLFVQGGYGNPGLNMFEPGFSPYYLMGARLTWNLGGLYTQKNDIQNLRLEKQNTAIQSETFLYTVNLKKIQETNEMDKIKEQLKSDDEIISLRTKIKKSAEIKVANGTLSVSDLIREISAENTAILEKSLHEIQLLMAMYNYKYTTNN